MTRLGTARRLGPSATVARRPRRSTRTRVVAVRSAANVRPPSGIEPSVRDRPSSGRAADYKRRLTPVVSIVAPARRSLPTISPTVQRLARVRPVSPRRRPAPADRRSPSHCASAHASILRFVGPSPSPPRCPAPSAVSWPCTGAHDDIGSSKFRRMQNSARSNRVAVHARPPSTAPRALRPPSITADGIRRAQSGRGVSTHPARTRSPRRPPIVLEPINRG